VDQQLLWIVAAIGAGTLAGTFMKMKGGFGPINLRAVGIVLIAVLASLLAIAKLDNITAAMGILGAIACYLFGAEAKEPSGTPSSIGVDAADARFGDNAKVAGRDINETVNNIERMLGDLQGLTSATIQNLQLLNEKRSQLPLIQRRTERFRWESGNPSFVAELKSLSRSGIENWTQRWIEMCLEQPECMAMIRQIAATGSRSGWTPVEINFDNHGDGVHVNMEFQREFPLQASAQ